MTATVDTEDTPASDWVLPPHEADRLAERFSCLADPGLVRLLHAVAAGGPRAVGPLSAALGISPAECARRADRLVAAGLLLSDAAGDALSVNPAAPTALPNATDVLMGLPARATRTVGAPVPGVSVRALRPADWPAVLRIYGEGISTGNATFETAVPSADELDTKWHPEHRWVAEVDGAVAGWAAITPISTRDCYAGVGETSVYVGAAARGRGVGAALVHQQIAAADHGGLWTLQCSIFPENRASLVLHHAAGFRTLGIRERIAQHHGVWRDTVQLERRHVGDGTA